jgi:hypothetical protein
MACCGWLCVVAPPITFSAMCPRSISLPEPYKRIGPTDSISSQPELLLPTQALFAIFMTLVRGVGHGRFFKSLAFIPLLYREDDIILD